MRIVGDKLAELALTEAEKSAADLYAKSACNRYYYHSWLAIREEMCSLIEVSDLRHGPNVGDKLHRGYRTKLVAVLQNSGLAPEEIEARKNLIDQLIGDLASLISSLYTLREAADYKTDTTISTT